MLLQVVTKSKDGKMVTPTWLAIKHLVSGHAEARRYHRLYSDLSSNVSVTIFNEEGVDVTRDILAYKDVPTTP